MKKKQQSQVNRPPRLLLVVNVSWFFITHRMDLALEAQAAGYDVHVATLIDSSEDEKIIRRAGMKLHHVDIGRGDSGLVYDLRFCFQLYKLYAKIRPDILHHVTMKPIIFGGIIARIQRIRRVVQAVPGLGYPFVTSGILSSIKRSLILAALRIACGGKNTKVIVQNVENKDLLLGGRVIRDGQARLIRGSGVDVNSIEHTPEQGSVLRVVLAARMLKEKGVVEFVRAARQLKRQGVEAEFLLAGQPDPGNPGSLSLSELESWHRSGDIRYLGFVEDINALFASCHIVCLPTYYGEGVPKVLIEAAAAGRAIVTTDQPGCRDIVRAGVNGELVPPRDFGALADSLRRLILDPEKRRAYGQAGRELARSDFELKRVIEQTLSIYSELLDVNKTTGTEDVERS